MGGTASSMFRLEGPTETALSIFRLEGPQDTALFKFRLKRASGHTFAHFKLERPQDIACPSSGEKDLRTQLCPFSDF